MPAAVRNNSPPSNFFKSMKYGLFLAASLVAACAPVSRPPEAVAVPSGEARAGFDPASVRADLEKTARERFGGALTDTALRSEAFLLAKHYHGLPLPPKVRPDGRYAYPDPPFAMLLRRKGQWHAAREGGFAALAPDKGRALDAALAESAFWKEPAYVAPGCTDAGSSLLWLKMPNRPLLVRQGSCGGTELSQRVIFLALDS
jgi:hypothetical protein